MSNLTIEEDTRITSSMVFDDLIWREGVIEVYPSAEIIMSGNFRFSPTESSDPVGKIYRAIKSRLALESGRGRVFEAFHFYSEYDAGRSYFFPCLIIHNDEPAETTSAFFGGEYMEGVPITIELAIKRDKIKETSEGTLSGKGLAEYYLYETRNLLDGIVYEGENVKVGAVEFQDTIHEPLEKGQTLFGYSLKVGIEFKEEL